MAIIPNYILPSTELIIPDNPFLRAAKLGCAPFPPCHEDPEERPQFRVAALISNHRWKAGIRGPLRPLPPRSEDVQGAFWYHDCPYFKSKTHWVERPLHLRLEPPGPFFPAERQPGSIVPASEIPLELCDLGCGYLAPRDTVLYNSKRVMVETLEGFNLLPGRFDDWFLSCCQCGNWELNLLKEHPSAQDSHVKRKVVGYNCCEHCERPDESRCELCFSLTKYLEANCWRSGEPVPGGVKWRHERARMERKEGRSRSRGLSSTGTGMTASPAGGPLPLSPVSTLRSMSTTELETVMEFAPHEEKEAWAGR
ncbi:hypothetical protein B0T20DRAFT_427064 [Sordaria brevicollis]|uniref:Uncharacterized protein n=1 Tax=Sordaria brevicollis TaxID=83679 RepID=A0AAE0NUQ8_SORBR|nr:hypothetical protein B0T20DRAFT_427064 [Sordaria brevicollis]